MILADTSIWVKHLRSGSEPFRMLLEAGEVACHPFVIGELACGTLHRRAEILALLEALPPSPVADHGEVMTLLEKGGLHGRGLGWIDAHLLASALLGPCPLWTLDQALQREAGRLGIAAGS